MRGFLPQAAGRSSSGRGGSRRRGGRAARLGLFGGTFNPIHVGHLRAAIEVREGFGLDEVILVPAATPPHKPAAGLAPAADRLAMARLAVRGVRGLSVSDAEIRRGGPSYTIDTVRRFLAASPPAAELFLIVGLDAFLEIDTWKSYRELLALVPVIVIPRPAAAGGPTERRALGRFLRARLARRAREVAGQGAFCAPGVRGIHLFPVTPLDISSRLIRQLLAAGRSIRFLAPDAVGRYIERRGLYR